MKKSDITIGMECYTKVSGEYVKVKITGTREYSKRTKCMVSRVDNGKALQDRESAALHTKEGISQNLIRYHGMPALRALTE